MCLAAEAAVDLDRPLRGREFFEELIRDNLDLGRPDRVQLIFDRVRRKTLRFDQTWQFPQFTFDWGTTHSDLVNLL